MPITAADDAELIRRCEAGEQSAWEVIVHRYQRLLFTIALRFRLSEATSADVVQTVFEKLYGALSSLQQPDRLQAWLVTTAKRECIRQRRLNDIEIPTDEIGEYFNESDFVDEGGVIDAEIERLAELNRLREAMDRLDSRCRRLITAVFLEVESTTYEDLARELRMPVGSIGPTRARCLAKLRDLLEPR